MAKEYCITNVYDTFHRSRRSDKLVGFCRRLVNTKLSDSQLDDLVTMLEKYVQRLNREFPQMDPLHIAKRDTYIRIQTGVLRGVSIVYCPILQTYDDIKKIFV